MKMGICSVLGLIFVTLILTVVITWSWWWVLLPFWGPAALAIILVFVAATVASKR